MKRRSTLAAEVLLHAVEVFDGHEEAIAFCVLELEVFAMRAIRLDQAHALEARDAVVDVHDQLVGREVQGELACHVLGAGARASTARRAPNAAEELGVRDQLKTDRRLRATGRQVERRMQEVWRQLEVQVEVDPFLCVLHARLVQQRPQPLVLLGREHDRRRVALRGQPGQSARLADQRFARKPAEVDRVARSFRRGDRQPRPVAQVVEPGDSGQGEQARQLPAPRLGGREHRRLVQQRARVDQLSARLEIQHDRPRRKVVDERRPGRVQVRGVELDPGEGGARAQSRQLVLPLRAHVAAKVVERDQLAQPIDRGRAPHRSAARVPSG